MKKLYGKKDMEVCVGVRSSAAEVVAYCLYTGGHRLGCSNKQARQGHKKGHPCCRHLFDSFETSKGKLDRHLSGQGRTCCGPANT